MPIFLFPQPVCCSNSPEIPVLPYWCCFPLLELSISNHGLLCTLLNKDVYSSENGSICTRKVTNFTSRQLFMQLGHFFIVNIDFFHPLFIIIILLFGYRWLFLWLLHHKHYKIKFWWNILKPSEIFFLIICSFRCLSVLPQSMKKD